MNNSLVRVLVLCLATLLLSFSGASALEAAIAILEPPHGPVAFNEVVPDNETTHADDAGEYDDWVELVNLSDTAVDLAGLYLTDSKTELTQWVFPAGATIPASGFLIVWCDRQPQQGIYHTNFSLSATGETIYLVDRDGLGILDAFKFDAVRTDESVGRLPDGTGSFFYLDRATPGATNATAIRQTPTPSPSPTPAPVPALAINEFMATNDTTISDGQGDYEDWVEIHNPSASTANLTGFYLSDDPDLLTKWQFPAGTTIAAGGFLIVWCDNETYAGEVHATFKLSATGEDLVLVAADGITVLDAVSFGTQTADVSIGRHPDGTGAFGVLGTASPGASNNSSTTATPTATPSPSPTYSATLPPIAINEFMASNATTILDDQGDYDDWIELHNYGSSQVNLSGFLLSDDPLQPAKWALPAGTTLSPGQFLLVWADNDTGPGILHTNFSLSAAGETILLSTPDAARVVDSVTFGDLGPDQAMGRLPNGTGNYFVLLPPTPGASNATAQTATPSPTPSPTPTPNPAAIIVINEVQSDNQTTIADGNGQYDDWIELYNTSDVAVDLGGLGLTDDPTAPGKFIFPAGTFIGAKGFLLVWADTEPLQGALHAPFGLSKTGEELTLYASDGATVLDYLRFGAIDSDSSLGRFPDGAGEWHSMIYPTPGAANRLGATTPTPTATPGPTPVPMTGFLVR